MRLRLLATHCKSQNEQPRLRERVILVDEALRAQLFGYCRIVISQTAAAKQLD